MNTNIPNFNTTNTEIVGGNKNTSYLKVTSITKIDAEYQGNLRFETDVWILYSLQQYFMEGQIELNVICQVDFSSYIIELPLNYETLELLNVNGILKVYFSKSFSSLSYTLGMNFILSEKDNTITFINENTIDLFYILLANMENLLDMTQESLSEKIIPFSFNDTFNDTKDTYIITTNTTGESKPNKQKMISNEIFLNKLQVTFLIGKDGNCINLIRDISETTIKILPISRKLNPKELTKPSTIFQAITIIGEIYNVAKAISLIESTIRLFKYNRK